VAYTCVPTWRRILGAVAAKEMAERKIHFTVETKNDGKCKYVVRANTRLLSSLPPPVMDINPEMITFLVRYVNDADFRQKTEAAAPILSWTRERSER